MTDFAMKVPRSSYHVQCHDAAGVLKWEETIHNIVFDAAIADVMGVYFKGQPAKAGWFIGLLNAGANLLPTDTAGAHPGWTENSNYTANQRPALMLGVIASKQVSNNLAKAVFVMNGSGGNIAGAFLISDSAKGGTTGMLYAAAPFQTGTKNTAATDTLTVAVTLSGA